MFSRIRKRCGRDTATNLDRAIDAQQASLDWHVSMTYRMDERMVSTCL